MSIFSGGVNLGGSGSAATTSSDELEVVLFSQNDVANGQTLSLADGLTWQEVVDTYEKVKVYKRVVSTNAMQSTDALTSVFQAAGNEIAMSMGTSSQANLISIDLAGGSFVAERSFSSNVDIIIVGVRRQGLVVSPNEIEVQDTEVLIFEATGTLTDSSSHTLTSVTDWQAVKDAYPTLRIETTRSANVHTSYITSTADWVASSNFARSGSSGNDVELRNIDLAGNTFTLGTEGGIDHTVLRVYGRRAQKTVIGPTDLPAAPFSSWSEGDFGVWSDANQQFEPATLSVVEGLDVLATLTQLSGTTWNTNVDTAPGNLEFNWHPDFATYIQEGNKRYYSLRLYFDNDGVMTFSVTGAQDVAMVSSTGGMSLGSGDFENRMVFVKRDSANIISVNRDDDTNAD